MSAGAIGIGVSVGSVRIGFVDNGVDICSARLLRAGIHNFLLFPHFRFKDAFSDDLIGSIAVFLLQYGQTVVGIGMKIIVNETLVHLIVVEINDTAAYEVLLVGFSADVDALIAAITEEPDVLERLIIRQRPRVQNRNMQCLERRENDYRVYSFALLILNRIRLWISSS